MAGIPLENEQKNSASGAETVDGAVKSSINAGRATTIENPCNGHVLSYSEPESRLIPDISSENVDEAETQIQNAKGLNSGKSFRSTLKSFYESVFLREGGPRDIQVDGAEIDGEPYVVTINKSAVGKGSK